MKSDKSDTANPSKSETTSKAKTARVTVLKKITYGHLTCAPGHVIPNMDLDEVKLRADAGEVSLIKVN